MVLAKPSAFTAFKVIPQELPLHKNSLKRFRFEVYDMQIVKIRKKIQVTELVQKILQAYYTTFFDYGAIFCYS